jgi:hypothetical protein
MISKKVILFSSEIIDIKAEYEKHGIEFEPHFDNAYKSIDNKMGRDEAVGQIAQILLEILSTLFPKAKIGIGLFARLGLAIAKLFKKK